MSLAQMPLGNPFQIGDGRMCPERFQQMEAPVLPREFRNPAVWIIAIAEDQRRRRTGLDAGRRDVTVLHRPSFFLRLLLSLPDALHAERAFFHNAVLSDRHVGIQLLRQRLIPVRIEPVELANGVGTIVAAVADPDAAVVHLRVQSFRCMVRRVYGTDRLAGRIIAVLAEHRHEPRLHVRVVAFPIPLDSDPVDCPPLRSFLLAGYADVIFSVTGHNAGLASGAAIEINDHFPLMGPIVL